MSNYIVLANGLTVGNTPVNPGDIVSLTDRQAKWLVDNGRVRPADDSAVKLPDPPEDVELPAPEDTVKLPDPPEDTVKPPDPPEETKGKKKK